MLIVVADHLPAAVRGRMKLWFIEVRPNVFVSGIKDAVADRVITYLMKHCPASSGVTFFKSIPKAPGYQIKTLGETKKKLTDITGLQLVIETSSHTPNNHTS